MTEVKTCPGCGADLSDPRSVIGVEVEGVYDGVLYWQCFCGHRWHRFEPSAGRLYREASRAMGQPEAGADR